MGGGEARRSADGAKACPERTERVCEVVMLEDDLFQTFAGGAKRRANHQVEIERFAPAAQLLHGRKESIASDSRMSSASLVNVTSITMSVIVSPQQQVNKVLTEFGRPVRPFRKRSKALKS